MSNFDENVIKHILGTKCNHYKDIQEGWYCKECLIKLISTIFKD